MKIKGAIFDMDGTLVDSLGFWGDCWREFGAKYRGDPDFVPDASTVIAVRTASIGATGEILHRACGFGSSGDAFCDELFAFFRVCYHTRLSPKVDACPFVAALSARGVKMCLASASPMELIHAGLERCGIRRYFPDVISCDDVGSGKDKPDVFLAALDRLGTPMEETWVFEDSPIALETARRAGFQTVGIFDRNTADQARVRAASTIYIGEGETFSARCFDE